LINAARWRENSAGVSGSTLNDFVQLEALNVRLDLQPQRQMIGKLAGELLDMLFINEGIQRCLTQLR
jgi:hypothetical protein